MTQKISIEVTTEQAYAISEALDFYSRMCIGQLNILTEKIQEGLIPVAMDSRRPRQEASIDQCDTVRHLMDTVKTTLGYSANGSNGIAHPHVDIKGHRTWEVKKVLDKALAELRNPNPEFRGVDYDGLGLLRYTADPAPVVRVEQGIVTGPNEPGF